MKAMKTARITMMSAPGDDGEESCEPEGHRSAVSRRPRNFTGPIVQENPTLKTRVMPVLLGERLLLAEITAARRRGDNQAATTAATERRSARNCSAGIEGDEGAS